MSSFYDDGYTDAVEGNPPSPPAMWIRGDSQKTDVLTQEYMSGYEDGLIAKENM